MAIQGRYDRDGVWVVLLGGDFELFIDANGRTTAFRRRSVVRQLTGSGYIQGIKGEKDLLPPEFESELFSHLALAVRRCIVPKDVIARSSVLVGIINKALHELEEVQDLNMSQMRLREEVATIRSNMFTRLMTADLRKGPIQESR